MIWFALISGFIIGVIATFCLFVIVGKRMEIKEPLIFTNMPN